MSHARRRRALRGAVLTATAAVLATFVVAPSAYADPVSPTTTEAPEPSGVVGTPSSPTSAAHTSTAPTSSAPPSAEVTPPPPSSPEAPEPDPSGAGTTGGASATGSGPAPTGTEATVDPGEVVVGELVQAYADPVTAGDHGDHGDDEPLSWIEPVDGDAVRVSTEALPDVEVGSTLAVTVGDEVLDHASTEQGAEPAVDVQAATVIDAAAPDPSTAAAGSSPTNTVTAVLVLPAGANPDGTTISSVLSTLNGPVSSFWSDQSNGTVRIAAVQGAAGWVSSTRTCGSAAQLWNDVAARVGWSAGPGKHLMLYVPRNTAGCAYGLGEVGSSIGSGGRSYVQAAALSVMAHELGHNFGLGHSSELQCDSSVDGQPGSAACATRPYYDFYDVMGISWSQVGSLNAVQADRLGLLPAAETAALTPTSASATVSLAPVSSDTGTRVARLTASDGSVYYVENRSASGQDAWLGDARNAYRLDSGIVVRRASAGSDNSLLLDGTPAPRSGWAGDLRQALPAGVDVPVAGSEFVLTAGPAGSGEVRITTAQLSPIGQRLRTQPSVAALGASLMFERCGLPGGGCYRQFQNGGVYWSGIDGDPARVVWGAMRAGWAARGAEWSALGYPVAEEACGSAGCQQQFQGGRLVWSASTGTQIVSGPGADRWLRDGGTSGPLGNPRMDPFCGLRGGACYQVFQRGSLYWSTGGAAVVVWGGLRTAWAAAGAENGPLGMPVGDERCDAAGCTQQFDGGLMAWSARTGAWPVTDGALNRPTAVVGSAVGFPVMGAVCGLAGGGCYQVFERGSLYWVAGRPAVLIWGDIRTAWQAQRAENGSLGYPVGDEQCSGSGCSQQFERGTLVWSAASGAVRPAG